MYTALCTNAAVKKRKKNRKEILEKIVSKIYTKKKIKNRKKNCSKIDMEKHAHLLMPTLENHTSTEKNSTLRFTYNTAKQNARAKFVSPIQNGNRVELYVSYSEQRPHSYTHAHTHSHTHTHEYSTSAHTHTHSLASVSFTLYARCMLNDRIVLYACTRHAMRMASVFFRTQHNALCARSKMLI